MCGTTCVVALVRLGVAKNGPKAAASESTVEARVELPVSGAIKFDAGNTLPKPVVGDERSMPVCAKGASETGRVPRVAPFWSSSVRVMLLVLAEGLASATPTVRPMLALAGLGSNSTGAVKVRALDASLKPMQLMALPVESSTSQNRLTATRPSPAPL